MLGNDVRARRPSWPSKLHSGLNKQRTHRNERPRIHGPINLIHAFVERGYKFHSIPLLDRSVIYCEDGPPLDSRFSDTRPLNYRYAKQSNVLWSSPDVPIPKFH